MVLPGDICQRDYIYSLKNVRMRVSYSGHSHRLHDVLPVRCVCLFIMQAFELSVPVGGGRGSSRKITYTNPYTSSRTFLLRSDHPDLLQFKEDKFTVRRSRRPRSSLPLFKSKINTLINALTKACQVVSELYC